MYEYILRADDMGKLDNIARQMELEGKALVPSYQKTMSELAEQSKGQMLSHKFEHVDEANYAVMEMNIHKIPYAVVQETDGSATLYISQEQEQRVRSLEQFDAIKFEDKAKTISAREADQKLERAKVREAARIENERAKEQSRKRGRD